MMLAILIAALSVYLVGVPVAIQRNFRADVKTYQAEALKYVNRGESFGGHDADCAAGNVALGNLEDPDHRPYYRVWYSCTCMRKPVRPKYEPAFGFLWPLPAFCAGLVGLFMLLDRFSNAVASRYKKMVAVQNYYDPIKVAENEDELGITDRLTLL